MYPKAWFTYPKAWFIYPKPWDKLCAGVTPTFSGENVNLFCRRKKVKILVGLKRCPVGHNGRSARPFSQDGVCVSPWGVALPPPWDALLTFLWGRPTPHRLRLGSVASSGRTLRRAHVGNALGVVSVCIYFHNEFTQGAQQRTLGEFVMGI